MKSREEKSIRENEKEKELEERRYRCAKCSESRKTLCFSLVFPLICGCGWSKSRLAKAAGAEPSGQMQNEKLHAPVARNTFWNILKILEVKMHKHTMPGPLLEVLMCKRMASAVAQSTFEVKMSGPKHILKSKCTKHTMLGPLLEVPMCKKLARRCGVKHILKSKRQKTWGVRARLEVKMSKHGTPLWREAHFNFQAKMQKTQVFFGGSDVETVSERWDRQMDSQLVSQRFRQLVHKSVNQLIN